MNCFGKWNSGKALPLVESASVIPSKLTTEHGMSGQSCCDDDLMKHKVMNNRSVKKSRAIVAALVCNGFWGLSFMASDIALKEAPVFCGSGFP